MSDDRDRGLYRKYKVTRTDGSSRPGRKHDGCVYYVLDVDHDPFAIPALRAYADACAEQFPALADDIRAMLNAEALKAGPADMTAADVASFAMEENDV